MSEKIINSYEIRASLGMTQKEFGERIGVTRDTVALWESNNAERRTKPRQAHVLKMMEIQKEQSEKDPEEVIKTPFQVEYEKMIREQIKKMIEPIIKPLIETSILSLDEKIDNLSQVLLDRKLIEFNEDE